MTFDLDIWKQKLVENLPGWKSRMQKAGVSSVYAAISAATLIPVVEAYQRDPLSAGMALGGVAAGVGANLLANQVQKWKDESSTAEEIASEVETTPELQAALDSMLEKLDALNLAEQALSDDDRAWFAQTIKEELSGLQSSISYVSVSVRDGAASIGTGAISVGKDATYIGGNVGGDYVAPGGTKITLDDTRDAEKEQRAHARRRYLERLQRYCRALHLAAMGGEESTEEDITLENLYIALDTTTEVPLTKEEIITTKQRAKLFLGDRESRHLTALEAAARSQRMVLLGDPGAGKSTFVRHLLAWQAAVQLEGVAGPTGIPADLLPVVIVLRELAPRLAEINLESLSVKKQRHALIQAVRQLLLDDLSYLGASQFQDELNDALESGRCLLVLDGLDEVPVSLRLRVRQAVASLLNEYHLQRVIITCRVRSYVGEAVFPDFQEYILASFDDEKVRNFARAWYRAQQEIGRVNAEQARQKAGDLAQAALGEDLRELSSNPMMLTSMAIVHQKEIGLPKERVRLYNLVVDLLLLRWQKQKAGEQELATSARLGEFLKDNLRFRAAMERLAYEAHRLGAAGTETADLPRGQALTLLEAPEYLGEAGLADEFLDYVDQRAGLLLGRGGEFGKPLTYSFPHRTFQEYLAGSYLVSQRDIARTYFTHASEGDYWALAALLGAEELYYNRRGTNPLLDLIYQLNPHGFPQDERNQRALLWSGQIAALLGSQTIVLDVDSPQGGANYLYNLRSNLVELLGTDRLSAIERVEAGHALGRLGDPRMEVTTVDGMQFCWVPAGAFRMGSTDAEIKQLMEEGLQEGWVKAEYPQHEPELPGFYIAKHLVTNAQYDIFVQAGGYKEAGYWAEAIHQGVWKAGFVIRQVAYIEDLEVKWTEEKADQPYDFGESYCLANHPVVGITWYEALAYCQWLEQTWQSKAWLPDGWRISLPSEAQWEKAARGGLKIPNPGTTREITPEKLRDRIPEVLLENPTLGRTYSWGNEFNSQWANTFEAGAGITSALGCFPLGRSPYGVQDLIGNVWEWTRSLWGKEYDKPKNKYPYKAGDGREDLNAPRDILRVLRGGSFDVNRGYARCAYRNGGDPYVGSGYIGFRVVVSPS